MAVPTVSLDRVLLYLQGTSLQAWLVLVVALWLAVVTSAAALAWMTLHVRRLERATLAATPTPTPYVARTHPDPWRCEPWR